jgi:pyridoxal phosphate phosphatase PHOSPHO2
MKRAVLGLKKRLPETTFLCLSNSNEVYIKTILEVSLRSLSVLGA